MALAYTPGLKIKSIVIVEKTRKLPIPGEVLVKEGEIVSYNTAIARAWMPGRLEVINASYILGCDPEDIEAYMLRQQGAKVKTNETIAQRRSFFGSRRVDSPFNGMLERVSRFTGQVTLRGDPVPLEVSAYMDGTVARILPQEGAVVETHAAFVQGIFGIGGETHGELMMIANAPDEVLTPDKITVECTSKVLVGGSLVTTAALRKAVEVRVKGIIVGGIRDIDLANFLGYEGGLAITGDEKVGLTLIVTEGFGPMRMSDETFKLLKSLDGLPASINGTTQIRAGVTRPEIIIPRNMQGSREREGAFTKGMEEGMMVRIIREPYFGVIGRVAELPVELRQIETESRVRILDVDLEDGRRVTVPRANVEIIEK